MRKTIKKAPEVLAPISNCEERLTRYLLGVMEDKAVAQGRRDSAAQQLVQLARSKQPRLERPSRVGRIAPTPAQPKPGKKEQAVKSAGQLDSKWEGVLQ